MSNRQFTWWRRFHTSRKLLKDLYWKGYSRLLQRIEFGEFEYDQLSEQTHLEELLYQIECQQIKNEFSYTRDPEIIQEKIRDRRKLKNKRVGIMMEKHLKREAELLSQLRLELAEEFSLDVDYIREYMETFDGTTDIFMETLSMNEAVKIAHKIAAPKDTVLLSPACSSFDLFDNYEDRGNQFKNAVRNL